jgi:type IV pilus assembly protein PilY1
MVDAWTGATLWRYTDDDFKAQHGFGAGTSMFPVPGAVALVDIGDPGAASLDQDGFYDTATWGDLGGNLFVARFQAPGTLDGSGRVDNWYAARTFEEQRRTDDLQSVEGRSEFFYMTANAYDASTRTLRTLIGSGNREQMMQRVGPQPDGSTPQLACGPDNLLACCQAGCTVVRSSQTDNYGACNFSNQFTCAGGMLQRTPTGSTVPCAPTAACAAAPANAFTSSATIHLECPGAGAIPDAVAQASCDVNGQCATLTQMGTNRAVNVPFLDPPKSRFYSVWAYGGHALKTFTTAATARAFDANRFTDAPYGGSCAGPSGGTCTLVETTYATARANAANQVSVTCSSGSVCTARSTDAGWFYEYGNVCPTKTCPQSPPWTDEKTGSSATVVLGCAAWGGFRPYGLATSTDPCSGNMGAALTYGYVADYLTGAPTTTCGYSDPLGGGLADLYRAAPRATTAPPTGATVRVTVNSRGQIAYSALSIDAGAPPASKTLGTRGDVVESVYWLEVPRELHVCRHVDPSTCE